MSSENDQRDQADASTGGTAARVGQPSQDRPEPGHGGEPAGGGEPADGGDRLHRVSHGDRADRGARWNRGDRPYVDTQALSDLGTGVYEAVATLEFSGRPVTSDEIVQATGLDAATAGEVLGALTEQGALVRRQTDAGETFELARRDWSATPERPSR